MKKIILTFLICITTTFSTLNAETPLTLQKAYEVALSYNEKIKISDQEIDRASARISQALGHILPRVSFIASETIQDPLPASFDSSLTSNTRPAATFNATQPIFHGLKDFQAIRAFSSLKKSNQYLLENAKRELFKDVAAAFLDLTATNKDLQTTEQMLRVMKEELSSLKVREKIGKVRTSERVRQESDVALLEANYEKLKLQKIVVGEELSFLTGLPASTEIDSHNLVPQALESLEAYLEKSKSRPDILAQAENEKSIKSLVKVEAADLYPQIDFAANYYAYRTGYQKDIKWDMMFKLNFTLDPFTEVAEMKEAKVNFHQASLQYDENLKNAQKEVMQSYAQAKSYLMQAKKFRVAANLAGESYRLQKADGTSGLVNELDILTSQRTWMQVLQNANEAEVNAMRAYLNLLLKSGVSL